MVRTLRARAGSAGPDGGVWRKAEGCSGMIEQKKPCIARACAIENVVFVEFQPIYGPEEIPTDEPVEVGMAAIAALLLTGQEPNSAGSQPGPRTIQGTS